ncbi:MAG: hypothetical protein MUF23_13670 [Pirellula sp.]|jgi:hypothetical protein|nr:hypothetical protein [Pirellula sp.]
MQVLVLRSKELELVCSKQPCVHGDVRAGPCGVACHSSQQELHHSKELELARSKELELVLVHSMEQELARNMELVLVHSRKEHRHIGCAAWHANVPTGQLALACKLIRHSRMELVRSKELELELRSKQQELVHSNRSCDGTNQPKHSRTTGWLPKPLPKQSIHDAFKSLPKQ